LRDKANLLGLKFLDRWDIYCDEKHVCPIFSDEKLLKGDKFHLTFHGAKKFGEELLKRNDIFFLDDNL
jgi:hypothetical protein